MAPYAPVGATGLMMMIRGKDVENLDNLSEESDNNSDIEVCDTKII